MRVSGIGFLAAFAASVLLATGCGRTWPQVRSVGDPGFLETGGVVTVDVLPMDVGISVSPETPESAEIVADRFVHLAAREVHAHLAGRGYVVAADIGPDGVYRRGDGQMAIAMTPEQLEAVGASLAAYGAAQQRARDVILTPYLPARLGAATGSDATLYVGGWGFAGRDEKGIDAGDVAKVVLVALFIVVVVAVAIVVAKKGGGGGGGKGGSVASAGGSAAARAIGGAGGSAAGHAASGAARVAARGLGRVARGSLEVLRAFHYTGDAWGRHHTHLNVYLSMPMAPPPPADGPSRTFLEMTLVDNRNGLVLWHARQQFPANPALYKDIRSVVGSMMAGLPASR